MGLIKRIAFDKAVKDALPENIEVKFRSEILKAEMERLKFERFEEKYFKLSPTSYFKVKSINEGRVGEKTVLSIRTVSYNIFAGRLCIEYNSHQTRDINFDFEAILSSKEELLSFIEKYI